MLTRHQKKSRHIRAAHSLRKNVWLEYEWQKQRLSQCPGKYETEARKVAKILGI